MAISCTVSFRTLLEEERAFNLIMSCKIHGTYFIFLVSCM